MKNHFTFILMAMLLVWSATTAQAQSPARISDADASFLLQKTIGNWLVDKSSWQADTRQMLTVPGRAIFKPSSTDVSVHEQYEFTAADGTLQQEAGCLRFSKTRHQFEFYKTNGATGKETLLFTGSWYPEFNTIMLTAVTSGNSKHANPDQWRYVFQNNGAFTKLVYKADKKGNMLLSDQYHHTPNRTAEL
ncbi:hypothetical protein [Pontibacter beigongshangensis]|uniref:hypothetical protein n=1 Tax=Pontibacter beigongshangensis TaxID=2574733 RepID=UPI00164F278C|nr:hypothetical protein [Pontibacter beigongshangensis]